MVCSLKIQDIQVDTHLYMYKKGKASPLRSPQTAHPLQKHILVAGGRRDTDLLEKPGFTLGSCSIFFPRESSSGTMFHVPI